MILFAILICSTASAWKIQRFSSHVVDPNAYEAVEVGMTKEQVVKLLREPADTNLTVWRYDKSGVFEFEEIRFDEAGLVKSKMLDR